MSDDPMNNNNALASWLQSHLPDCDGRYQLEKFASGQSNPSYLLNCGKQQYVLRRKPPGQLLASAHAVDREYRLIKALQGSAVPVPTAVALCEDDNVIGSMFYIMTYEAGDVHWDPALPEIASGQRRAYYQSLIDTLASLHDVDYESAGLQDFGRPGNYFARQLSRWTKQYQASATQSIPAMDRLIDWLQANLPDDDGQSSIIHGDYRLDNVMFFHNSPEVRAVLDWELATLGHPMADLAYYLMALRLPGEGEIKGLQGLDLSSLGIPEEAELIDQYCRVRHIKTPANWEFYMAFSFFRLAAILQGVYKRGLDGNASSARATRMGELVKPLAELGLASII